jgi:chromosome segregation ATPase
MAENQVIIIVLTVIGSVFAFYMKLRKDITQEEHSKNEPIEKLNENIIKLNATINFLTEMINNLKTRVTNHGSEIDELKIQNQGHEERIKSLEKHCEEISHKM